MILVALSMLALAGTGGSAATDVPVVAVKVTHSHLRPVCLDGEATKQGEKSWRLAPGPHSMAFTMRNEPRTGAATSAPGFAAVSFTVEAGHKYEIEVRAPAMAFSQRVWEREDWKPVVRDRTSDRLVSSEPGWNDSGACKP